MNLHRKYLLLSLALVGLLGSQTSAAQNPKADRPDIKPGDSWIYQTTDTQTEQNNRPTTLTVQAVHDNGIEVQTTNETQLYTRDWNLIETRRGEARNFIAEPFLPRYAFPLEIGKKWKSVFNSVGFNGARQFRNEWHVQVEGVETITVPAGTFDTFRLRIEGYYNCTVGCSYSGSRLETVWYAPAAKRHVKLEIEQLSFSAIFYRNHQRSELLSFTAAP